MAIGLFILLCVVVCICAMIHVISEAGIRSHVRVIRESPLPSNLDELNEWAAPAFDGPNAAQTYRDAFRQLEEMEEAATHKDDDDDLWPDNPEELAPEELQRLIEEEEARYHAFKTKHEQFELGLKESKRKTKESDKLLRRAFKLDKAGRT